MKTFFKHNIGADLINLVNNQFVLVDIYLNLLNVCYDEVNWKCSSNLNGGFFWFLKNNFMTKRKKTAKFQVLKYYIVGQYLP